MGILVLVFLLSACSIEKRRYTQGYHIEWMNNNHSDTNKGQHTLAIDSDTDQLFAASVENETPEINTTPSSSHTAIKEHFPGTTEQQNGMRKNLNHKRSKESEQSPQINAPTQAKEVHPEAYSSLVFGCLGAASLLTMFFISFSPALIVGLLLISTIVFSLLAIRMAKSAFRDMHYARHRYSGQAMAAAGMVLGIVTIVGLIGFIVVLGMSIVFGAFT